MILLYRESCKGESMAKKTRRRFRRILWTKADDKALRAYSRKKMPVKTISKKMRRTEGALRQRALKFGISLGHRR
jgi:hypothetical protein